VRVVVGQVGEANQDITQHVAVLSAEQKWGWLMPKLVGLQSAGQVLIFVTKKANAEALATNLKQNGQPELLLLHGDMDQSSRNAASATLLAFNPRWILGGFLAGSWWVLGWFLRFFWEGKAIDVAT
jgi:superfamily II DNA/RNA helicase